MVYKFYMSIDRKPVSMNIEKAHKDRNHETSLVEINIFFYLFNDDDFSICRCYYNVFCILRREETHRTLEKIEYDAVYNTEDSSKDIKGNFCVKCSPQEQIYGCNGDETPNKRVGSLSMYSDFL